MLPPPAPTGAARAERPPGRGTAPPAAERSSLMATSGKPQQSRCFRHVATYGGTCARAGGMPTSRGFLAGVAACVAMPAGARGAGALRSRRRGFSLGMRSHTHRSNTRSSVDQSSYTSPQFRQQSFADATFSPRAQGRAAIVATKSALVCACSAGKGASRRTVGMRADTIRIGAARRRNSTRQ